MTTARHPLVGLAVLAIVACMGILMAPRAALGATPGKSAAKVVRYHGYRVVVPGGWPVYRLAAKAATCVRFDRHAVYLGQPGTDQRCRAGAAGRTEAILVAPLRSRTTAAGAGGGTGLPLPTTAASLPARGSAIQLVKAGGGVLVTATWGRHPAVIEHALGVHPLPRVTGRTAHPSAVAAITHTTRSAKVSSAPSQPGAVYTGDGFDACSTPSSGQMSAWGASPYRAIGVYIGGTNMACTQTNLTPEWVVAQSAAGWHLVPIYVGLEAPGNSCGCAAISSGSATSEGTAAALDAITTAQAVGLGPGNPLYFDMEGYNPSTSTSATVLRFLAAWTAQLHASGYKSGVYSSADSGIRDLAASAGTGYLEPDDIWIANWNGAMNTSDPNVPSADWSSHERLHQYQGDHNETYNGDTINIDGDYVDAATAAAGTGGVATPEVASAPSLTVSPEAGGAIDLHPSWPGAGGVSSWQALGGATPTSLVAASRPVGAGGRTPIVVNSAYPYFGVRAIGSAGQMLGSSPSVATPSHLAIVGRSAFIPGHGNAGLPVECFQPTSCSLSTTVSSGRATLATTGPEQIPTGGGVVYFSPSSIARGLLRRSAQHRLEVKVVVRDSSGLGVTRQVNLVPFTTSGISPRRSLRQGGALKIIGTTDFVSHGWSGGILSACLAAAPCAATVKLTSAGKTIASSRSEQLGVNELGYLSFSLTAAGHKLITRAHGNQLAANLTIRNGATTASGRIVLASFR